jgi:hypothetical protein
MYTVFVENLKGRDNLAKLFLFERIALKLIMWTGFNWSRIGSNMGMRL